jgi:hypothetical protein
MLITTSNSKYGVGEVHEDSDLMAERSATVTRRVQPARGKGFCEAETLMPITTPNLKIGCLVGEDLRRDFVEAIKGNTVQTSVGHKSGALFTPVYCCVSTYPCIAASMHPCIPVSLSCE